MQGQDRFRWVPIAHYRTLNRTWDHIKWEHTRYTELGIAMDPNIDIDGGAYGAGVAYGKGHQRATGIAPKVGRKKAYRNGHIATLWRYKRQRMTCTYHPTNQHADTLKTVATKTRRYVGWSWNGDAKPVHDNPCFTCRRKATTHYSTWQVKSKSVTLTKYFEVWGVRLSSTQHTTTSTETGLIKRSRYRKFRFCGNQSDSAVNSPAIWETGF